MPTWNFVNLWLKNKINKVLIFYCGITIRDESSHFASILDYTYKFFNATFYEIFVQIFLVIQRVLDDDRK